MHKGLLSILSKAHLVNLSPEEELAIAKQEEGETDSAGEAVAEPEGDSPPVEAPVLVPLDVAEVNEGVSVEEIFAQSNLPSNPYPAEKMLKLLAGLQSMDVHTRKTVVKAMDEADETWVIGDPVADASVKVGALQSYKQGLVVMAEQKQAAWALEKTALGAKLDEEVASIRKQIQSFQELLDRTVVAHTEAVQTMETAESQLKESVLRETIRMDAEITKYNELIKLFASE